jgi:hypothetical protein
MGSKQERGWQKCCRVLRRCAQVEREQNASASEVRSEGGTMSDYNLLWNSVMYMNICSLKYRNQETRKGKGKVIRRTK